uniref:Uncharacterized protein n=1 Tax=Panagrolaimus sp. ES5 TaxID=591445 RepID=A0AC34FMF3_9BILA
MNSVSDINPDTNSASKNDQDDNIKEEKQKDNEEGILSKIADGVQQFAEALAAGERNVVTDSLNHPTSGQADLIATNKKALKTGETMEAEKERGKF